ncbi:MAG TPA: redoxin domain-containing protein, partial [Opitutaceae bacterium]
MKPTLKLFVFAAALAASLGSVASAKPAAVGQQAPDFTLTSIDGQTYSLSQLKGKTVVLEWVNPE